MKQPWKFTIAVCALALLARATSHAFTWELVNAKVRHDFPEVKRITTGELAQWLGDETRPAPLLLDVRTTAEFDLSHLRGARHVDPVASAATIVEAKTRPLVTYCSVGYRSAVFAQRLTAPGYERVLNLEGSIFRWANEGRPVYGRAQPVAQVHPYNRVWGLLLRKELRAPVPSIN